MVYLLGINLPDSQLVSKALTKIYGVGPATAASLSHKLCIHPTCRLSELPEPKLVSLSSLLNSMKIESELKRSVQNQIKKQFEMGTLRGIRHKAGLPVRGQKTRANARTARRLNGLCLKGHTSAPYSTMTGGAMATRGCVPSLSSRFECCN